LHARQVLLLSPTRPEGEEDNRQLKSPSWRVATFCTTRLIQIIWPVLLTLLADNLLQVYANTKQGQQFADWNKTFPNHREKRKFEP
jgi:tryptophan-rich sensory protein